MPKDWNLGINARPCQNYPVIKVLSAAEMREVDRLTTERYGIPSIVLMENAARSVVDAIEKRLGTFNGRSFLVLCGRGNNGGDGAAIARMLNGRGALVRLCLIGAISETSGDARLNFEAADRISDSDVEPRLLFRQDEVLDFDDWFAEIDDLPQNAVIVDALFGTGLTRPLEGKFRDLTFAVLTWGSGPKSHLVVSVDVPSGLNSDLAHPIGPHISADLTVTFTAPKLANVFPPASNSNGELIIADIGSPQELIDESPSKVFLAEAADARRWMAATKFTRDSYKNKRGHALFVVGSRDYSGAAALAGNAAMRTGVGLVTVVTTGSAQAAIAEKTLEEVITRGLAETNDGKLSPDAFDLIEELSEKANAIGIGCGLGIGDNRDRLKQFIEARTKPTVLDADALNALAPFDLGCIGEPKLVLTPHEGEFLRLLGTDDRSILDDRVGAVRDFAVKHNVVLVLKGERVLIGDPSGRVVINPTGNSGLGKAGNGDTLTGIVTGFIAQGDGKTDLIDSVVAAVYIAGRAGDIARERFGERVMLASDVRDALAAAFAELETND